MKAKKLSPGDLFALKPSRRRGRRRVGTHAALLLAAGLVLLGSGLFGRSALVDKARRMEEGVRVEELLAASLEEARSLAADALGGEQDRALGTALSSMKRALKADISQHIANGEGDEAAARSAVGTLLSGLEARFEQEKAALAAAREDREEALVRRVVERTAAAAAGLNPGSARVSLPVSTRYYPLMYYHAALETAGALCLGLSALLAWVLLRGGPGRVARAAALLEPMDYLFPFFLGVAAFTLYPIVRVVLMSFQERYRLEGSFTGWGTGNYAHVLRGIPGTSNYFLQGLRNTLVYVLLTVPASTALAIGLAWLLNRRFRLSALFQTAYFMPMVTSVTAVGLVWRWIFNRDFGILNALLGLFGAGPVNWLQAASHSMTVLVVFGIWSSLPFTIILLLSGLQNIDENFYTVARVDGARALRIFRRITVPLLSPTIGLVLIINSISAFKVFTEVKVLFNGNPGPVLNLYTVVYYIYDMMYENRELGRAAAAAIVLFLFIFAFTMLQRLIQRRWKYS